jgi:hypothetical protein
MKPGIAMCGIAELPLLGQDPVVVLGDRHGQRAVQLLPVGEQLVQRDRIDHRARQDMRTDLGALFENADRDVSRPASRRAA